MRIYRSRLAAIPVALTAVLGLAPAALASPQPAAATARWHIAASFRKPGFLFTIAAPSGRDVWALGGGATKPGSARQFPAGLHWNGRRWSPVLARSFPKPIRNTGIGCAGASSPSNVWAFAGSSIFANGSRSAGALKLVNGHWKLIKKFDAGIVTGCLVLSPTQLWVFGDAHVAPGTGTWHLSGKTWTHQDTGRYVLSGASAIKPDDLWAEGENFFAFPVVARWNGHRWSRNQKLTASLPKATASRELFADGITALSDKNVLLRVIEQVHSSFKVIVLRWNGNAWRSVKRSDPDFNLPGAVADGHGGRWALSTTSPDTLLHQVHGHWTRVPVHITGCTETPTQLTNATGTSVMLGLQTCGEHQNVLSFGKLP